jgi:hypothetical protein
MARNRCGRSLVQNSSANNCAMSAGCRRDLSIGTLGDHQERMATRGWQKRQRRRQVMDLTWIWSGLSVIRAFNWGQQPSNSFPIKPPRENMRIGLPPGFLSAPQDEPNSSGRTSGCGSRSCQSEGMAPTGNLEHPQRGWACKRPQPPSVIRTPRLANIRLVEPPESEKR